MQSEMDVVEGNRTWEHADLPRGHHTITLKWMFKLKMNEAGAIVKHKARLEGIDYDDAFVLVARMESVRLLLRWLLKKVGIYIDDLVIAGTKDAEGLAFNSLLIDRFGMKKITILLNYTTDNLSDSRQSPTNESTDQPKRFRVKLDPIILMVFYAIREFIGGGCALDFCLSSKRYVSAVNTELKSYVQLLADDVSCKKLIMFFSKKG
uniref:Reverse transcriptase Ty1/copia-type domain-containing protein n=1 Tax=Oryza brachyantha TaxID=4533 RepID=J3ND30_ORYBR